MPIKDYTIKDCSNKVRSLALSMIYQAQSGHPGGALSCADLITYLYKKELNIDDENVDKFVLSKGHSCPTLYAIAAEIGLIPYEELISFRAINSNLQGHPSVISLPWVNASTGSLGQGISAAVGIALSNKHHKLNSRTYCMIGDGEIQEGQVWEALMFSSHHKLDNLCIIVDYNKMQSDALNSEIISIEPLSNKFESFGIYAKTINGHSFEEIEDAFNIARENKGKPTIIIANTVKGKGVSYMENIPTWHGSVAMSKEQLFAAYEDLEISPEYIKSLAPFNF